MTAVDGALRDALGPVTGALVRALGDFHLAEDVAQDAAVTALERWPVEGVPEHPRAWLLTVARHRAIDRWRREARLQALLPRLETAEPEDEDRLSLLFTCCHPALAREAQPSRRGPPGRRARAQPHRQPRRASPPRAAPFLKGSGTFRNRTS